MQLQITSIPYCVGLLSLHRIGRSLIHTEMSLSLTLSRNHRHIPTYFLCQHCYLHYAHIISSYFILQLSSCFSNHSSYIHCCHQADDSSLTRCFNILAAGWGSSYMLYANKCMSAGPSRSGGDGGYNCGSGCDIAWALTSTSFNQLNTFLDELEPTCHWEQPIFMPHRAKNSRKLNAIVSPSTNYSSSALESHQNSLKRGCTGIWSNNDICFSAVELRENAWCWLMQLYL